MSILAKNVKFWSKVLILVETDLKRWFSSIIVENVVECRIRGPRDVLKTINLCLLAANESRTSKQSGPGLTVANRRWRMIGLISAKPFFRWNQPLMQMAKCPPPNFFHVLDHSASFPAKNRKFVKFGYSRFEHFSVTISHFGVKRWMSVTPPDFFCFHVLEHSELFPAKKAKIFKLGPSRFEQFSSYYQPF